MNKNILIITGSPRKNGNSDLLAQAFAKGAGAKGHAVSIFSAAKNMGGCMACDTCWSKGRACSFTDAFTDLEPLLEQADVIVFATPLYWFGFSSQIKAAIDRLYAYESPRRLRSLHVAESVLLACAGEQRDAHVFDGLVSSFTAMLRYLNWRNAGVLTVLDVQEKGDIMKIDALEKAERLGGSL